MIQHIHNSNNDLLPIASMATGSAGATAWIIDANEWLQAIAFVVSITTGILYLSTRGYDWYTKRNKKEKKTDDGDKPPTG